MKAAHSGVFVFFSLLLLISGQAANAISAAISFRITAGSRVDRKQGTALKCMGSDIFYTRGNPETFKIRAFPECVISDLGNSIRDQDIFKIAAGIEGISLDLFYAGRKRDGSQMFTVREGTLPDFCDLRRNDDFLQLFAICESSFSNLLQAVRKHDLPKAGISAEYIFYNKRESSLIQLPSSS